MRTAVLALADSRFPGGGHAHSGGVEEAITSGIVSSVDSLREFLRGRLRVAGSLQAVFAAAATHAASRGVTTGHWKRLDAEIDARTPSTAQRESSRAQGGGTLRAGRSAWPSPALERLASARPRPHHPLVLGALAAAGGSAPRESAHAAAYLAVSGPSSGGVRLLGLDPMAVNATVAALEPAIARTAEEAARWAGADPAAFPAPGGPALDLLAEEHDRHHHEEGRLFAS